MEPLPELRRRLVRHALPARKVPVTVDHHVYEQRELVRVPPERQKGAATHLAKDLRKRKKERVRGSD